MQNLAIVIPTYNEAGNIAALLTHLAALYPEAKIFVVDDSSPDGSANEVRKLNLENVHLIDRPAKAGMASAYLETFSKLIARPELTHIITMDADFSHDPEDLQKFITVLPRYEMIIGSRYVPGGTIIGWSAWRRFISYFGNIYTKFVLNVPIRDLTAGFVVYERQMLVKILAHARQRQPYAFQTEMKYHAHEAGAKILEMPVTFRERRSGKSKIKSAAILEALFFPWYLKFVKPKRGPAG